MSLFKSKNFYALAALICIFFFNDLNLNSQTPANFSGKWNLNLSKSTLSKELTISSSSMIVTQKDNEIIFNITIVTTGDKTITRTEKFFIGSNVATKSKSNSNTLSSAWSSDKQSFTTTELIIYNGESPQKEFKEITYYSITNQGKTMIIKADDELPAGSLTPENERHTIRVYDKTL